MSALTLTASQRSALRGLAHGLDARVHIGQHGVTAAVIAEIDAALRAHGLIKVRVLEAERAEREEMLGEIANALFCAPVQHIGRMLIFWRPRPEDALQLKVDAPSMKEAAARSESKASPKARSAAPGRQRSSDDRPRRGERESVQRKPRSASPSRDRTPQGRDFSEARKPREESRPRRDSFARPERPRPASRERAPEGREFSESRMPRDEARAPRAKPGPSLKDDWFDWNGDAAPARPAREAPKRSERATEAPSRPSRPKTPERTSKPRRSTSSSSSPRGRKPGR